VEINVAEIKEPDPITLRLTFANVLAVVCFEGYFKDWGSYPYGEMA